MILKTYSFVNSVGFGQTRDAFLALMRLSLWDTPVETQLFTSVPQDFWSEVLTLARQQAVDGLIADAILRLPEELRPPRATCLELIGLTLQIEKLVKRQEKALSRIQQLYERLDAPFVLLKGLGVAQSYPNPRLRMPGDLDLYLYRDGDYTRINNWARSQGYKMGGDTLYEQVVYMGDTVVENHLYITYFGIERYDIRLSEHMKRIREHEAWSNIELFGCSIQVLPPTFNAVYIFHHILHHFAYLGIGLRQISDWFVFLSRYNSEIDKDEFVRIATDFDLLKPMQYFAQMGVTYLGVPPDIFPFALERATKYAHLILQDTFEAGNFGFEHFSGKTFSSIWSRRLFMFRKTTLRGLKVAPISPEHIRSIPLIAIATRIRLLWRSLPFVKK